MTISLADKARAGRRAALTALNTRIANGGNVVSIFNGSYPRRIEVAEFRSVRAAMAGRARMPTLLLTERMAA